MVIAKNIKRAQPKPITSAYSEPFRELVSTLLLRNQWERPDMAWLLQHELIAKHLPMQQRADQPVARVPPPGASATSRAGARSSPQAMPPPPGSADTELTPSRRAGAETTQGRARGGLGGASKNKSLNVLKRFGQLKTKIARGVIKAPPPKKGDSVMYKGSEKVTILAVHVDVNSSGPDEEYFTVAVIDPWCVQLSDAGASDARWG